MADITIDGLPNDGSLKANSVFPSVTDGTDRMVYMQEISAHVRREIAPQDVAPESEVLRSFLSTVDAEGARTAIGAEVAGTAAELIAAIPPPDVADISGATAVGKGLMTRGGWRYVDTGASGVSIPIFSTDASVLIDASGWSLLRLSFPAGLYDGQEIRIVTTGTVSDLMLNAGATVMDPRAHDGDAMSSTFSWIESQESWIRLG